MAFPPPPVWRSAAAAAPSSPAVPPPPRRSPYARLRSLVLADGHPLVLALPAALDVCDADAAAKALLATIGPADAVRVLRALVRQECEIHAARPAEILRQQSVASRALGQHARGVGAAFLHTALGAVVDELLALPRPLDMDPAKLPPEDIDANTASIAGWLERCVGALTSEAALEALPAEVCEILGELRRHAEEAEYTPAGKAKLFGVYLILRLVSPAIVTPEAHGLCQTVSDSARTSLKLLAKLVQAAANGTLPREAEMAPLHETIREATPRIQVGARAPLARSALRPSLRRSLRCTVHMRAHAHVHPAYVCTCPRVHVPTAVAGLSHVRGE